MHHDSQDTPYLDGGGRSLIGSLSLSAEILFLSLLAMCKILRLILPSFIIALIAPRVAGLVNCTGAGCLTREMLGVWTQFRNDKRFNYKKLWRRINTCYTRKSTSDVNLWKVMDNFWAGFLEYGIARGSKSGTDPWDGADPMYLEDDPTASVKPKYLYRFPSIPPAASGIIIYEPCNTVSNIAYLWTLVELCEYDIKHTWTLDDATVTAHIQAITMMTPGSMLYHGSATRLGRVLDSEGVYFMALVAHQGSIKNLPYDPITHDISTTPMKYSGIQATKLANQVIADDPVDEWFQKIRELGTNDYGTYFIAFFSSLLVLVFPDNISTPLIKLYSEAVLGKGSADFAVNKYAPAIRLAFQNAGINPDLRTRIALFSTFQSIVIRFAFAASWQEGLLSNKYLKSKLANFLAAAGIPAVNLLCNMLAYNDRNTNTQFQRSIHVYPGDLSCSIKQPHSKWHEVSANVFVDIVLLSDSVAKVVAGEQLPVVFKHDLFKCYDEMNAFSAFTWTAIGTNITNVFVECFSNLINGLPRIDIGNFTGCVVTAILRTGNSNEAITESPTNPNLEDCLVQNNCLQFHNTSKADIQRLKECVGLDNHTSPCGSLVSQPDVQRCLLSCGEDSLCSGACLEKYGALSSWVGNTIGCLSILTSSNSPNDAVQSLCFREIADPMTQFQSSVVSGMQSMALHSIGSCSKAHLKVVNDFTEFSQCYEACHQGKVRLRAIPSSVPEDLACTMQCMIFG